MSLTPAQREAMQRNAAIARQTIKDRRAAEWSRFMTWAKRGAAERLQEIRAELHSLNGFMNGQSAS